MSDMDFDGFFDALEKADKKELLKKSARQLLLMSAYPFDAACEKVEELERENKQLKTERDELLEALKEACSWSTFARNQYKALIAKMGKSGNCQSD